MNNQLEQIKQKYNYNQQSLVVPETEVTDKGSQDRSKLFNDAFSNVENTPTNQIKSNVQSVVDVTAQGAKDIAGGVANGVGGIALSAIDYLGRKAIENLDENNAIFKSSGISKQQMLDNLAQAKPLQSQLADTMGADQNSALYTAGIIGGNIAAIPATGGTSLINTAGKVGGTIAKTLKASEGVTNLASKVAGGAAAGYLGDTAYNASTNAENQATPGVGTAIGAALPVIAPVGRLVKKAGEKLVDLAIPMSAREAQVLQNYQAINTFIERISNILTDTSKTPRTTSKTAIDTKAGQTLPGLFGTKAQIGVQANRAASTLWKDAIEPRLQSSNSVLNIKDFFKNIEDELIKSTPELTRQKSLLEALDAVKTDYKDIINVTMPKLQKLKEGWAEFVPQKFYKGEDVSGALQQVRALLSSKARSTIYDSLGEGSRQAYIDYGNLVNLKKLGQSAMTGSKLKGGAGSFVQEIYSQAVTPIATIAGQVLYRTGKGIEFIGKAGEKTLGGILNADNGVYDVNGYVKDIVSNTKKMKGSVNLGAVSEDLSKKNLIDEAKKYKSAEEFIKAQRIPFEKTMYRGEGNGGLQLSRPEAGNALGEGKYYADLSQASRYGKNITEHNVKLENPLYITTDQELRNLTNRTSLYDANPVKQKAIIEDVKQKVLDMGHDGAVIKMKDYQSSQYLQRFFGHDQVIDYGVKLPNRSQLTDIWNKANKK